eukprot:8171774-Alexandrium_andersonii.AAC.1
MSGMNCIARAITADGNAPEAVQRLAACGSHGRHPSNIERDTVTWLRNAHDIQIEPYEITLDIWTGERVEPTPVAVLAVHELLAAIWRQGPVVRAKSLFGPEGEAGVREFWRHFP